MDTANKILRFPVKITDKQWADKLQDGSVFMRSLYEYGSWSAIERAKNSDTKMKDGIQGDIREGVVRRVDPQKGDDYFNSLDPDIRKVIKEPVYIDEDRYQYFKIYCMYGLTYILDENRLESPNKQIRGFGNAAVIILNVDEFLSRLYKGLQRMYGNNALPRIGHVRYYQDDYSGPLNEFCKHISFAWQNEIRIRVALLDPDNYGFDKNGIKRQLFLRNRDPITVEIGDIRDISVQIPVDDLIHLKLPDQITNLQFTMIEEDPSCPTST